jgi:hypothetical protein
VKLNQERLTAEISRKIALENKKADEERAKKAKYKIQVWFRSNRSMHKPVTFSISFWESGKRLHGGGDEMMFICRRHESAPSMRPFEMAAAKVKTEKGCNNLISGDLAQETGMVVCPHCHVAHRLDQIGDSIMYNLSINQAAEKLAWWWRKIGSNADIYAKYSPTDPRTVMMSRNYNYRTAREKKGLTIYPLENILKDTLSGSTLESRFRAFITA